MKIMHLIKHVKFGHGNAHAAVDLACAQAGQGDEVTVISAGGDYEQLLSRNRIRHVAVEQEPNIVSVFSALRRINAAIGQLKPDIIHAHMVTSALLGLLPARLHRTPIVATSHNTFDRQSLMLRWSDAVVAVSKASAGQLARRMPRTRIAVVLNGTLGAQRRSYFDKETYALDSPSIGTICGLHPRKGIDDLIAAFDLVARDCPQASLYIAGGSPMRKTYEDIARACAARDRIHFVGSVRDTRAFLDALDIFVLASHAEPFGLVLTEAREAGCAIVATDVDGIPEALDGGHAGLLVPPRDPATLAHSLLFLAENPQALRAMQERARSGIEAFHVDRVAREHEAVYRQIIAKAKGSPVPARHEARA